MHIAPVNQEPYEPHDDKTGDQTQPEHEPTPACSHLFRQLQGRARAVGGLSLHANNHLEHAQKHDSLQKTYHGLSCQYRRRF